MTAPRRLRLLLPIPLLLALGTATAVESATPSSARAAAPPVAGVAPAQRQERVIGIIGGIAWPSTLEYYRILNERVRDALGPPNSAAILLYSIPFGEFAREERQAERGDWAALTRTMVDAGQRLRRGGADFILIASNTMNSTAEVVEREVGLPVLHIADAVGQAIAGRGLKKVALLGTGFTMGMPFYRDRLKERHGIEVAVPQAAEREAINAIIFDELVNGVLRPQSKARMLAIVERMVREDGVQGVILGCTEIPLLIQQSDLALPAFDSMTLHAEAAVAQALSRTEGR